MAEVFVPHQPFMHSPGNRSPSTSGQSVRPTNAGMTLRDPSSPFASQLQPSRMGISSNSYMPSSSAQHTDPSFVRHSKPYGSVVNALPAFDFNPSKSSASASNSSAGSPTRQTSPGSNVSLGHRRTDSEFIGGTGRIGLAAPSSTSPTKGEFPPEISSNLTRGPPPSRRGHAHRRSGAVSTNDITSVTKPTEDARGNSLPTTPSDPGIRSQLPPPFDRSISHPESSTSLHDGSPTRASDGSARMKTQPRARVGFSDTIEFIPRPLSTISSETSSSLSTIRASHSVTGSISSIITGDTSSPQSLKLGRSSSDPTLDQSADRSLHMPIISSNVVALEPEVHYTLPQPFTDPLRGLQTSRDSGSAVCANLAPNLGSQVTSAVAGDPFLAKQDPSLSTYALKHQSRFKPTSTVSNLTRPRSSPEPKITKRQKKVRSWADSILPRRARTDDTVTAYAGIEIPNKLQAFFAPADEFPLEHISFDEDTTCVIRDASQIPVSPKGQLDQPSMMDSIEDSDVSGPVLDLDAAFEALETSSIGVDHGDHADGGLGAARRRMHSSGTTGGFSGPGMHYHRRAESAPEMVPFDHHPLGFPRFGSNPKMADVFEEDEEDDDTGENRQGFQILGSMRRPGLLATRSEETASGLEVKIIDVESSSSTHPIRRSSRSKLRTILASDQRCNDMKVENRTDVASDAPNPQSTPGEAGEVNQEPHARSLVDSCSEDSDVHIPSVKPASRPVSAPIGLTSPKHNPPSMTPETLSSAVSSPDFNQTSFDVPRLHTASSSMTDRTTLNSNRAGENSFNLRASVDDVPSLTSSASTAISAQQPRISSSAHTYSSVERSSSLSAAVPLANWPATTSKRSSLASLSRLVGASHSERSKLHIEESAQVESSEKVNKKRGNRISRLMRFWRSRDKLP